MTPWRTAIMATGALVASPLTAAADDTTNRLCIADNRSPFACGIVLDRTSISLGESLGATGGGYRVVDKFIFNNIVLFNG